MQTPSSSKLYFSENLILEFTVKHFERQNYNSKKLIELTFNFDDGVPLKSVLES
jgi:hypothetical protein